jgi:sugar phosphate isomerase/epimerase
MEDEADKDFSAAVPYLCHAHIATYRSRFAPGQEDCDFTGFMNILRKGGYADTLSIEGKWAAYDCGFGVTAADPKVLANPEHLKNALDTIRKYL